MAQRNQPAQRSKASKCRLECDNTSKQTELARASTCRRAFIQHAEFSKRTRNRYLPGLQNIQCMGVIKVPPVALELNVPPVAILLKVPPKNIKSAMNSDDDDHNIPDLFAGVYDTCCRCGYVLRPVIAACSTYEYVRILSIFCSLSIWQHF